MGVWGGRQSQTQRRHQSKLSSSKPRHLGSRGRSLTARSTSGREARRAFVSAAHPPVYDENFPGRLAVGVVPGLRVLHTNYEGEKKTTQRRRKTMVKI